MNRQILNITANEQILSVSNPVHISTNKVSYIEARFDLGTNWSGYDSVRAVWFNDFQCISTVLDANGKCLVPFEVMKRKGNIKVNLVGSISEDDVLTDRLTSYPIVAVVVDCVAQITGSETSPITPSQFEQFVATVKADADRAEAGATNAEASAQSASGSATASATSAGESEQSATEARGYAQDAYDSAVSAESAKDDAEDARDEIRSMRAEAVTLPPGSDATASYSDGLLSLGIPKGDKGEKGNTGNPAGFGSVSATVDGSTGTPSVEVTASGADTAKNFAFSFHNLKGAKGDKGDTGEVTLSQLEQILPTDTASGSIASFSDGSSLFNAKSVVIGIEPIQSGTGTPSPDNVRPISGWTGAEVNVSPTTSADDGTVYNISWQTEAGTVYGGEVECVEGGLESTYGMVDLGSLNWLASSTSGCFYATSPLAYPWASDLTMFCSALKFDGYGDTGRYYGDNGTIRYHYKAGYTPVYELYAHYDEATSASDFKTAMNGQQLVAPLATPQTYNLTPTDIALLQGQNNVWADCGDTEVTYKADIQGYIDKKINALI